MNAESVTAKTVHMAISSRDTAFTHDNRDLMQRLRQ